MAKPLTIRAHVPTDSPKGSHKPTALEKFLGRARDEDGNLVPRKKRQRKTVAASTFARTRAETERMIESRQWDSATARHLVALYVVMHERTYGIPPEMSPSDLHTAALRMGGFIKRTFAGDVVETVSYFRWVWMREIEREEWRRENAVTDGRRLGFGLVINGSVVTDWKLALHRQGQHGSTSAAGRRMV